MTDETRVIRRVILLNFLALTSIVIFAVFVLINFFQLEKYLVAVMNLISLLNSSFSYHLYLF